MTTKGFDRVTNPITPTTLYLVPPDVLRLEVEFDASTTAKPMDVARKWFLIAPLRTNVGRRLFGLGPLQNK